MKSATARRRKSRKPAAAATLENVKVAGLNYKIQMVCSDMDMNPQFAGLAKHYDLVIKLDAGLSSLQGRKVLLHELIHAVDHAFLGGRLKEKEVVGLENGLWALFADNPGLKEALFDAPKGGWS